MKITKQDGGNILVQYEEDYDAFNKANAWSGLIELLCNSIELDFVAPDELYPMSLGNSEGYTILYNANNGLYYMITGHMAEKFASGEEVELEGYEGDESEKELFKLFYCTESEE